MSLQREKEKELHNWQKLLGTFLKCRDHRVIGPDIVPLYLSWKLIDWTSKMVIFPSGTAPGGMPKHLTQSVGITNSKGDSCLLEQNPLLLDIF
jgi:hypothetical protein